MIGLLISIIFISRRVASRHEMRRFSEVVGVSRRHMARVLGLAKTLREQLEVAIEYRRNCSLETVKRVLQTTGHAQLTRVDRNYAIYVPGETSCVTYYSAGLFFQDLLFIYW